MVAALVVSVGVILGWYKETGSKAAAILFAGIPVFCLLCYLGISPDERRKTEQCASAEFNHSWISKSWHGFLHFLILAAIGLLVYRFITG